MQSLLLLLGPTLVAASIYMMLGRLIALLQADKLSLIRSNWLTKVFVVGDMLSFFAQSGGTYESVATHVQYVVGLTKFSH